jgi:hypothetical protein
MNVGKSLLYFIPVLVVSAGMTISSHAADQCDASASPQIAEECACQAALNENTDEALDNFLRKYPASDTICSAKALSSVDQRPDGDGPQNGSPN